MPWQHVCTDGEYVLLMGGGVPRDVQIWDKLIAWMDEEGAAEDLHEPQYREALFQGPRRQTPERRHIQEVVGRFVRSLSSDEVYRRGQSMRLPWSKVRLPEENLDDPHWEERGFFLEGDLAGHDGTVRYPGTPYRFTATVAEFRHRAPLLGEHNFEVYVRELGLSEQALHDLSKLGAI
jgi:crotonobetainyl-CoA:carnitine CoA-transferase CaiB-like acyl-CoA transferase